MVRKKTSPANKASVFAAPAKVLLLEKNRATGSPRIPISSQKSKTPSRQKNTPNVTNNSLNTTKKKRRVRPGIKAIREIRKFQKITSLLIPKLPFSRVVREILNDTARSADYRMSSMALMALQEAAEMAMVNMFEVANLCCIHAHRVTVDPRDVQLTRRAFGLGHPINY